MRIACILGGYINGALHTHEDNDACSDQDVVHLSD